jgi:kynureninase
MEFKDDLSFAEQLDAGDALHVYREKFSIPQHQDQPSIYFCGNSLGLQPQGVEKAIYRELEKWKSMGVEGHFTEPNPWVSYHKLGKKEIGKLIGAQEDEVVIMNNLTTNLHLLIASFYQPTGKRKKVMIEAGAFPSDHFAITSHMRMKGTDPNKDLIQLEIPPHGYLDTKYVVDQIRSIGDELALILLPGVQYYTGQFLKIPEITEVGHEVGAYVGFDLAHAIGNVPMNLHDDHVDFATWCSYKYLNSGPGNVSGIYIHQDHGYNENFPRLAGWWGQDESIRFRMENDFQPMKGVDGWMLSNVNILSTAIHLESLKIFDAAGIENLREKSIQLTGYLEYLLLNSEPLTGIFDILTPSDSEERGCQLSLFFRKDGRKVFDYLSSHGVIMDWREPNVIRVAPTPLYNTFTEVYRFKELMIQAIR